MAYEIPEPEKKSTNLLMNIDAIKKLIAENPELPLVLGTTRNVDYVDYYSDSGLALTNCVHAKIGEILDCRQVINDCFCFTDREYFKEVIYDNIEVLTGYDDRDEQWYRQEAERIASLYDPYWKKCIIIQVGD